MKNYLTPVSDGAKLPVNGCPWPVLKSYEGPYAAQIQMPVGGIGTGSISVSGTGELIDWEYRNYPARGYIPSDWEWASCFILRYAAAGGGKHARLLQGPLDRATQFGSRRRIRPEMEFFGPDKNTGMPRFKKSVFRTAYPFAAIEMSDPVIPLKVTMETYNPFIRGDSEKSSIPAVFIRYRVKNISAEPAEVGVMGEFMIPPDGGVNERSECSSGRFSGVKVEERKNPKLAHRGEIVLMADPEGTSYSSSVHYAAARRGLTPKYIWDRFLENGDTGDYARTDTENEFPLGCVALNRTIPSGGEAVFPFAIAWRYPVMIDWDMSPDGSDRDILTPYYATRYDTAEVAAEDILANTADYEKRTADFVNSVLAVNAPECVKEAALFNLSTFKSTTCIRNSDGRFYGWEGSHGDRGSCFGSCTHVWGYEHALVDIWPDLERMRLEDEFGPQLLDNGHMCHRAKLPLCKNRERPIFAVADGQLQCIIKAYEYYDRTRDLAWVKKMFPSVRKALEFCWIDGGWDGDKDGVIEGCQHNTMDCEYYGPNPQMEFLYLAALEAVAELGELCDESDYASSLRTLAKRGREWTEKNLFNGEYYEHKVVLTGKVAPGTCAGKPVLTGEPMWQLANGCLIDQLVGEFSAWSAGLPSVVDHDRETTTLASILKYCRKGPDDEEFNNMRSFVFPGETSLKMAGYPGGKQPEAPFPYYRETMSGFEYVVAGLFAKRGEFAEAERIVKNVRDRHDGMKRNPFDEIECGSHYARALAAWTVLRAYV